MSNLFKPKKPPPAPVPTPAVVMPTPDTTSVLDAKKRSSETAMQRAGRASTILSDAMGDYGSKKLGGL
jgi:hypothetical protein